MITFQDAFLNDQDDYLEGQKKSSKESAEEGWNNNRPGATDNSDNERIPTVTPDNENGLPGPDRLDEEIPDDDGDLSEEEDEAEDDEDLIPIEEDDEEDEGSDPDNKSVSHDIDFDTDFSDRPLGRTTGRMIDHEPGTIGNT